MELEITMEDRVIKELDRLAALRKMTREALICECVAYGVWCMKSAVSSQARILTKDVSRAVGSPTPVQAKVRPANPASDTWAITPKGKIKNRK